MSAFFVITHGTTDYGAKYVVREHRGLTPHLVPLAVVGSLEEARGAIEEKSASLVRVDREPWDDAVIVETWADPRYAATLRHANAALRSAGGPR